MSTEDDNTPPLHVASMFVKTITVRDPDTGGNVELEIRKLSTGPMVGIDGSYLDQDVGPVYSPYDKGVAIHIPDDEDPVTETGRWDDDSIQFPRLLAEIYALGLTPDQVQGLEVSMDLTMHKLFALFARAEAAWERIKQQVMEDKDQCPQQKT